MFCSVCGAMIPDGQTNCPSCGAMIQQQPNMVQPNMVQPMQPNMVQPMQPNMVQPMQPNMVQPMQPAMNQNVSRSGSGAIDVNGLAGALKSDVMKIVSLVGAFILFLAPFFSWCTMKVSFFGVSEKKSFNMFKLAGSEVESRTFILWALILLAVAIILIIIDIADYVPALQVVKSKFENIKYFDLILIGVALLVVIIALLNGNVNDGIKAADMVGKGSHGIGPVFAFLGIIAAATPRVLNIVNNK